MDKFFTVASSSTEKGAKSALTRGEIDQFFAVCRLQLTKAKMRHFLVSCIYHSWHLQSKKGGN
jgi:hypothetical protein